jgi:hypothetical protein
VRSVLVERDGRGRTEHFAPFRFADGEQIPPPGSLVAVVGERVGDGLLIGRRTTTAIA